MTRKLDPDALKCMKQVNVLVSPLPDIVALPLILDDEGERDSGCTVTLDPTASAMTLRILRSHI